MAIRVVTPPAVEPITLTELKAHLRITHDDEDTILTVYLKAARMYAETTLCWRAFITQELELARDSFPSVFSLPRPPLQAVTSIIYRERNGTFETIDPADYIVDTDSEPPRIVPAADERWPSDTLYPVNAVRVRYLAGYGAAPDDVPTEIRQGILILAAHFYEVREPVVIGTSVMVVPMTAEALLMPYRVWGGDVG